MSAIGRTPAFGTDLLLAGALNQQDNGTVTLTMNTVTGEVLSVQPDGSFQLRPAGTAGTYELARVDGHVLIYCPDSVHVYAFPFFVKVPNQ